MGSASGRAAFVPDEYVTDCRDLARAAVREFRWRLAQLSQLVEVWWGTTNRISLLKWP